MTDEPGHFGPKHGNVFTIDSALALAVIVGILAMVSVYLASTQLDHWSQVEMLRVGNDITTVLHYRGALESLNNYTINSEMSQMLPANMQMRIWIDKYKYVGGTCEKPEPDWDECFTYQGNMSVGPNVPTDRFVAAGARHFIKVAESKKKEDDIYAVARFHIWLR